jgi:hypothetical protein
MPSLYETIPVGRYDGHDPLEILGREASGVRDGTIVEPQLGNGIVTLDVDMGWLAGFMAIEEKPEGPFPVDGRGH